MFSLCPFLILPNWPSSHWHLDFKPLFYKTSKSLTSSCMRKGQNGCLHRTASVTIVTLLIIIITVLVLQWIIVIYCHCVTSVNTRLWQTDLFNAERKDMYRFCRKLNLSLQCDPTCTQFVKAFVLLYCLVTLFCHTASDAFYVQFSCCPFICMQHINQEINNTHLHPDKRESGTSLNLNRRR